MSLTEFLNIRGYYSFEGNSSENPYQTRDLIELTNNLIQFTNKPNLHVMEIGFNAGHSAETFLKNNTQLSLVSFDLGIHNYITASKNYIDHVYPDRHTLILGDSRETVPRFISENKDVKFDVIFIDGGHEYEIAKADMENCFHLAHKDTVVILDDTMFTNDWIQEWTIGPTQVWAEKIQTNQIVEFGHRDYCSGRGMAWGKYLF